MAGRPDFGASNFCSFWYSTDNCLKIPSMKSALAAQLAVAALGTAAILVYWRADGKWPNPFKR